jgi:integrase
MPKVKLTPKFVLDATAEKGAERTIYWDEGKARFGLMVTSAGSKSYVVQYRNKKGESHRMTIAGSLSLERARREANKRIGEVDSGRDPLGERRDAVAAAEKAAGHTLQLMAEKYFAELERAGKRTIGDRRATFVRLIYPKLGKRQMDTIRRSEIGDLLDAIAEERGPVMADHALAYLRHFMKWYAPKNDDFKFPTIGLKGRTSTKDRARQRTLDDNEIRAIWSAAEGAGNVFGRFVQFVLLTGCRRNEAAHMDRREITEADWLIPAARHKNKQNFWLPLSADALATLANLPVIGSSKSGFVFTSDGKRPMGGFSKFKRDFDKACGVTDWTIHDLRRTARTLMSRAGVQPRHAEMAIGHTISGVEGVYDRWTYRDEKRAALEAVATQIKLIINPVDNVVQLHG